MTLSAVQNPTAFSAKTCSTHPLMVTNYGIKRHRFRKNFPHKKLHLSAQKTTPTAQKTTPFKKFFYKNQ